MNYKRIYNEIIDRRKNEKFDGYTEKHHIVPKCLGGDDSNENLVDLSAREHFICHYLLTKIYDDYRIKFALHMLSVSNSNQNRYKIKSSKIYAHIKELNSIASSERNKNISYQNGYVTAISKDGIVKRFASIEDIPLGWVRGSPSTGKSINKGKVYAHNGCGKVKAFDDEKMIPNGWIRGNPNAAKGSKKHIKGKKYYHNPITFEEGRFEKCPIDWVSGRSVIWITNNIKNKQIKLNDEIPFGWKKGRFMKGKK